MDDKPEMPTPDMPQVLLEHHLKALRLPTILSEYDKVARQCIIFPSKCIHRRVVSLNLRDSCSYFSRFYEVSTDKHTADNQADDNQHYRKLNERESPLCFAGSVHQSCILTDSR